ncbi:Hint domain-containing protein [Roseovarius sp. C7]|uniref:Hint domain-containing protein n=1 Tax=Roseovarius sp. C7 TaxID=3398643 RepID=UPI0039F664B5
MITTTVREADDSGGTNFNGDNTNEEFHPDHDIGSAGQQSMVIDGVERAVLYDYSFTVTDGAGNFYEIAVIDADLDGDSRADSAGEDGYYLIFIGDPPPPNTNLTVSESVTNNSTARAHSDLGGQVVCFAKGTLIATARGPRPIETLRVSDLIQTCDNGLQPLRLLAMRRVQGHGCHAPVRFRAGVLGNERDLWVSPQHRMLLAGWRSELTFGESEVLLPAVSLVGNEGVVRQTVPSILYCHMLFDAHQLVLAEGALSESLHPGQQALAGMAPAALRELCTLFPELDPSDPHCGERYGQLARTEPRQHEVAAMPHF